MVGAQRFELWTLPLKGECSIQLSYTPINTRMKTFTCTYCKAEKPVKKNTENKFCDNHCQQLYQKMKRFESVISGNGSHRQTKTFLLERFGNICMSETCAWDFTKLQINVELEHIDGNSDNNVLSNCILLCPNCHGLTDTYKSKNKGNGRHYRRERYANGQSF